MNDTGGDPFAEGWQARRDGDGANPYPLDTDEAEEWEDGYAAAAVYHGTGLTA